MPGPAVDRWKLHAEYLQNMELSLEHARFGGEQTALQTEYIRTCTN